MCGVDKTVIDGAVGEGKCQVEGCPKDAIGTLMWRHLPGMVGDGQADFCRAHAYEIRADAFMAYWREFAEP